ncbi:MAG: glycosyltransferase family 9 protein [Phycisphaerales bacterium]
MKTAPPISLQQRPERVLIIRPSALGDVCRSVPVLASLRRAWPDARIDWLVRAGFEGAVAHHPSLSRVISFPRKQIAIGRLWRPSAAGRLGSFLRELRGPGYDLVLDCQGLARSGLFALVTGARDRVGFANAAELGRLGLNRRVHGPKSMHTVDRMLTLVEALGIEVVRDMRLYSSEADASWAMGRLGSEPVTVLAPTSRWAGKRWPIDRFVALAERLLADELASRIAVVGAKSERGQCAALTERFAGDDRVIDLVGATDVGKLLAVIERASLVVANDSAALHMAVGFDRPTVGLFGLTDISLVGPYRREADVIQAIAPENGNRHKDEASASRAMAAITLDAVYDACAARLATGQVDRAAV